MVRHVFLRQDGFNVDRRVTQGRRRSSVSLPPLRCEHFFKHACFGRVGTGLHILTNDTTHSNSSFFVYDWWAGSPRQPKFGQTKRQVNVLRVSREDIEQYATSSQRNWIRGALLVHVAWPEQNHLGHFSMTTGSMFEYADAVRTCSSDGITSMCAPLMHWTLQPNDKIWAKASWTRALLPSVMHVAFAPLCHTRGSHTGSELLSVRHEMTWPQLHINGQPRGNCATNVYLSVTTEGEKEVLPGIETRLPIQADWAPWRRRIYRDFHISMPTRRNPCHLLITEHKRRALPTERIRALASVAGFQVRVIDLGAISVADQLRAIAQANVIVTREGSHLANLIAAQQTAVLVCVTNCDFDPDIMWLPDSLGMRTAYYRNTDARMVWQKNASDSSTCYALSAKYAAKGPTACISARNVSKMVPAREVRKWRASIASCWSQVAEWKADPLNCDKKPNYFCDVVIFVDEMRFLALLRNVSEQIAGCCTTVHVAGNAGSPGSSYVSRQNFSNTAKGHYMSRTLLQSAWAHSHYE